LKKIIFITLCILFVFSINSLAFSSSASDIKRVEDKIDSLEDNFSITYNSISLCLSAAGFVATLAGLGFAVYGLFNIFRAKKIVNERINSTINKFKKDLSIEFYNIQDATQKMLAGYNEDIHGDIDKAIELYKQAIEAFPNIYNGHTSLGYAYLKKSNKIDALMQFKEAVSLFPDDFRVYNDLARVYAILGQREDCIINLKKMYAIDKSSGKFIKDDPVFNKVILDDDYIKIFKE
jgi:tetratricopeptide (TPR) repeat protein